MSCYRVVMRGVLGVAILVGGCYSGGLATIGAPCGPGGVCPAGQQCDPSQQPPVCTTNPSSHSPDAAIDMFVPPPDGPLPRSCKDALAAGITTDGALWIEPDGTPASAMRVYCEMTTAGGGWMLVWSYGFTNYGNFTNGNNAITPRPSWGLPGSNASPQSTNLPTSPTTHDALTFAQWKNFGSELLVTSTINNWIHCTPGNGSLVTLTAGSISCQVVNVVNNKCTNTAPNNVGIYGTGPALQDGGNGLFYFFDGGLGSDWPTHDPCGSNNPNQLNGVADPGGAVYVR